MLNVFENTQVSLLAYIKAVSDNLLQSKGFTLTATNFDAHATESTLPEGDLLGIESLSMAFAGDELDSGSVIVTIATEGDVNNMRLSQVVNYLVNALRPTKGQIPFYDNLTEEQLGNLVITGKTRVMPVDKQGNVKTYQSIGIQFAVLAYETKVD